MSWRNVPENFFSAVRGCPRAVRKNQPLVPRSNLGGNVCARTNPWFRGQTLLVLGHGGGGYMKQAFALAAVGVSVAEWQKFPFFRR